MAHEAVAGADGGYVVCVGLPLHLVSEVARLLQGRSVVLATADTEGARALLGPPDAAHPPASVPAAVPGDRPEPLVHGPLLVDRATREARVDGEPVHLSVREFDLLATLASETDRVWSFAELHSHVWHTGYLGDPDHVTSAVKRLRRRLRPVPGIEVTSVRGVGYRLRVTG